MSTTLPVGDGIQLDAMPRRPSSALRSVANSPTSSIAITLLAVLIVGLVWVGTSFVDKSNLNIIGTTVAVPLLLGTFGAFALLAGVVDLSIGSNAGLSATIFAYLILHHWSPWPAALVVICAGIVIGLINALVVVRLGASPIAATLGMLSALSGLQYVVNGTAGSVQALVTGLYNFSNKSLGPVPLILVLLVVLVIIAVYVVTSTRVGRHIRAVGGDERAAQRAGISVSKIRLGTLIMSGIGGALAGILYIGQLGGATNELGSDLVFLVYAGLMIGGYSIIRGGVGNPAGGAMGLVVIAGVTDIIAVKSINTYYTDVIVGILLLLAVLLDRIRGGDAYE
jgi:ribose/xylose/arabinose/galactoside ABC-type transport system permease subunit